MITVILGLLGLLVLTYVIVSRLFGGMKNGKKQPEQEQGKP